jgi:hypothetical protein
VGSEVRREGRCGQARTAAARETEEVVMAREVVVRARAAVARAAVVVLGEVGATGAAAWAEEGSVGVGGAAVSSVARDGQARAEGVQVVVALAVAARAEVRKAVVGREAAA